MSLNEIIELIKTELLYGGDRYDWTKLEVEIDNLTDDEKIFILKKYPPAIRLFKVDDEFIIKAFKVTDVFFRYIANTASVHTCIQFVMNAEENITYINNPKLDVCMAFVNTWGY